MGWRLFELKDINLQILHSVHQDSLSKNFRLRGSRLVGSERELHSALNLSRAIRQHATGTIDNKSLVSKIFDGQEELAVKLFKVVVESGVPRVVPRDETSLSIGRAVDGIEIIRKLIRYVHEFEEYVDSQWVTVAEPVVQEMLGSIRQPIAGD